MLYPGVSFFRGGNNTLKDLHIYATSGVAIGEYACGKHNTYQ